MNMHFLQLAKQHAEAFPAFRGSDYQGLTSPPCPCLKEVLAASTGTSPWDGDEKHGGSPHGLVHQSKKRAAKPTPESTFALPFPYQGKKALTNKCEFHFHKQRTKTTKHRRAVKAYLHPSHA